MPNLKPHQIKAQCVAKRAFEVAATGDLRVLLIGPLGTSKTTLRETFASQWHPRGNPTVASAERETCPCGHHGAASRQCVCSTRVIERWYRRLERTAREFDIVLEVPEVPARELMSQLPPDPQQDGWLWQRINNARKFGELHTSVALGDDSAMRTMEMAARRLSLTPGQYDAVLRTARAIANLDGSDLLKAKHIAEAVQYRADVTIYRLDRVLETKDRS